MKRILGFPAALIIGIGLGAVLNTAIAGPLGERMRSGEQITGQVSRAHGFGDAVHSTEYADSAAGVVEIPIDAIDLKNAVGVVEHRRPCTVEQLDSQVCPPGGYWLLGTSITHNVKTNGGIDFNHTQSYGTSPAGNGLNYIALSNDAVTENAASTTLSNEIVANGLSRAIGAVVHNAGATTTTIAKTFTCTTTSQAAQKAALFTAASVGTMHHVLAFTQRTLQVGDTLTITFTITLS